MPRMCSFSFQNDCDSVIAVLQEVKWGLKTKSIEPEIGNFYSTLNRLIKGEQCFEIKLCSVAHANKLISLNSPQHHNDL